MIDRLLDALAGLAGVRLYAVTAVLSFAETAILLDLVVPGEVGMVLAGAAGARGGSPLLVLIAAAGIGAALGDGFSYAIGRRYGVAILERWSFTRRRMLPAVDRATKYFDRHGGAAVFLGRWVGALRAVVPLVAGAARMPLPRFIAWNLLASFTWAGTVVALGYVFGEPVASVVDRIGGWLSAIAIAAIGWWLVSRRMRRRSQPSY